MSKERQEDIYIYISMKGIEDGHEEGIDRHEEGCKKKEKVNDSHQTNYETHSRKNSYQGGHQRAIIYM